MTSTCGYLQADEPRAGPLNGGWTVQVIRSVEVACRLRLAVVRPGISRAVTSMCQPAPAGSAKTKGSRHCSSCQTRRSAAFSNQRGSAARRVPLFLVQVLRSVEVANRPPAAKLPLVGERGPGAEQESPDLVGTTAAPCTTTRSTSPSVEARRAAVHQRVRPFAYPGHQVLRDGTTDGRTAGGADRDLPTPSTRTGRTRGRCRRPGRTRSPTPTAPAIEHRQQCHRPPAPGHRHPCHREVVEHPLASDCKNLQEVARLFAIMAPCHDDWLRWPARWESPRRP